MSIYYSAVSKEPGTTPDDSKAHHIKNKSGQPIQFKNPFPSCGPWKDFSQLHIGLILLRNRIQGKIPFPDTSSAQVPTVCPRFQPSRAGDSLRTTWLGHASCFVEFPSGFRALFDPVFEERCVFMGPKRFTPVACRPEDFPALDAVFISHSHHDHLSYTSVKEIVRIYPRVHFFVGLGLARWFQDSGINTVTEMDWWDDAEMVLEKTKNSITSSDSMQSDHDNKNISATNSPLDRICARISCLPSQHTSMRAIVDKDRTLWASWAVTSGAKSVWFAGDTGYRCIPEGVDEFGPEYEEFPRNPQFSQIGELRGPFDLGLIPIGAYQPRFIFSPVHASPYDAVEIYQDTKCKRALGIHWGTWALTSEPVDEPPKKLQEALKLKGLPEKGLFEVCAIGESRDF